MESRYRIDGEDFLIDAVQNSVDGDRFSIDGEDFSVNGDCCLVDGESLVPKPELGNPNWEAPASQAHKGSWSFFRGVTKLQLGHQETEAREQAEDFEFPTNPIGGDR